MKQISTEVIILGRIDYGEADRILTALTPNHGKLRLMARGVRRIKSKLAGGIELFSISDIVFTPGRGEIGTLISSRLSAHYANISVDLDRTMLGYELIKLLNKNTEDQPEPEYFMLLKNSFIALDDQMVRPDIIKLWFIAQLLYLAGHAPNLRTNTNGQPLDVSQKYDFALDDMAFVLASSGRFSSQHIKMLRLAINQSDPRILAQVQGGAELAQQLLPLLDTMSRTYLRV